MRICIARCSYSQLFPTSIGYPLANVPKQTFNCFLTHNLSLRVQRGVGRELCGEQDGELDGAVCAGELWAGDGVCCGHCSLCDLGYPTVTECYQVLQTAMKQVPGYWVFNVMVKRPVYGAALSCRRMCITC